MKLRVKNLSLNAGRPVVFLHEKTAHELNVFANDRVSLTNSRKIYAAVDIFSKDIKPGYVGLSKELSSILNLKNSRVIEVNSSEISPASYLVKRKMQGGRLTEKEIALIISEIVKNNLTEAEIAYFTAAEKIKGLDFNETLNLTKAMVSTGAKLSWRGKYIADKHCIGGIAGNRTTPLVVCICAVAGLILPKTSSRAITSASGTADVIEVLARVDLPLSKLRSVVKKTGACLAWGGALGLAPSDDKIIKVERLLNLDIPSQMIASIMSKKISAGSKYLLIDIPYGKGTKVKNLHDAQWLGNQFKKISNKFSIQLKVVYTKNSRPIGSRFGPVLEMFDVLAVLKNEKDAPKDLREKSLYLSSELLKLCGVKNSKEKARQILDSGAAYEKFKEIVNAQNGKKDFDERVAKLKLAKYKKEIIVKKHGRIKSLSNKGFNSLCRILGSPETRSSGVHLHISSGKVKRGEIIMTLYSQSQSKIKDAIGFINKFSPIVIA